MNQKILTFISFALTFHSNFIVNAESSDIQVEQWSASEEIENEIVLNEKKAWNTGFSEIITFFNSINNTLREMDGRMAQMDYRMAKMDDRMGKMDDRMGKMDDRMAKMESELGKIKEVEITPGKLLQITTIPSKDSEGIEDVEEVGPTEPGRTTTEAPSRVEVEEPRDERPTPTPPRRPKPTRVSPTPFRECALHYPELPLYDQPVSIEDGVRFGDFEKTSRLEFMMQGEDRGRSEYSIEFKTDAPDGLIFFRSNFFKPDYVALFMRTGILHFALDSSSGPVLLNSTRALNDSQWHTAVFTRTLNNGELSVDDEVQTSGQSPDITTDINAGPILYLGGLPADAWAKQLTRKNLLSIDSAFRGCLKNFRIQGKSPAAPTYQHSVHQCSDDVEPGYFFYPNSGYLSLGTKFIVGMNIRISLSIKSRHPSGLIMSVHGQKDYIVLQMINGTVKFTVENGHGSFTSSYPKGHYDLCDGKWHEIVATKTKNVATLFIDGQSAQVGLGVLKSLSTDTSQSVFLGGQPNPGAPGVETSDQFVGCMKDFVIQGRKPFKFSYDSIIGKVGIHSCPLN